MAGKIKPSKELVERLHAAVRGIGNQAESTREVIAEVLGLHRTDLAGVDFLYAKQGACTAGELSKATGLSSGATTTLIDRLEKAGFAVTEDDPNDRRRQMVRLSDRASKRCAAIYEPIRKDLFRLWSSYTADELELVEGFITKGIELHAESLERLRSVPKDPHRTEFAVTNRSG
jgi:DNA-binding MarR family transcriptional regulator